MINAFLTDPIIGGQVAVVFQDPVCSFKENRPLLSNVRIIEENLPARLHWVFRLLLLFQRRAMSANLQIRVFSKGVECEYAVTGRLLPIFALFLTARRKISCDPSA